MRIKAIISYDGTNYFGYQRQTTLVTIQSVLEEAIFNITKMPTITFASGRTDALVHARGQVIHFDTMMIMEEEMWKRAINSFLPEDIRILEIEFVGDDFHARYSAKKKEYRYYINIGDYDVFTSRYAIKMYNLDVLKMQMAVSSFVGIHDFTSFSYYVEKKSTIKEIYEANIKKDNNMLEIRFVGNGFLKYMVRIMVGTLIEIGLGRIGIEDIEKIFSAKDRCKAGKTALAKGLVLYKVYY